MRIKTILNRIERHPGFVYREVLWHDGAEGPSLEVRIRPRAGQRARCSNCDEAAAGYDTLAPRRFEFVPLWGMRVVFVYPMRRVDCPRCGVVVERVPWADGKHRLTHSFAHFLARWAKRLSWQEVAEAFQTSWDTVFRAVERAVAWGLAHRELSGITAIGIDEVLWQRGYRFLTVVYELTAGRRRLLWIGREREEATLHGFFDWLGDRVQALRFICSDMWKPYLKVIGQRAAQAVHVLDRFHIVARMNQAIDEVRAKEAKLLRAQGYEPILKRTRWLVLKRPEHLTEKQEPRLADLLRFNLRTVRAYLLKEDFQAFWEYVSPAWAGKFLDRWCRRTMRSRLEPMKKIAASLRAHRELILNWFRARKEISAAAVEGLNGKLKLVTKRAYGFRGYRCLEVALYHALGDLPEPPATHRFC
jgi:transposase